jgi:hypothetical protein
MSAPVRGGLFALILAAVFAAASLAGAAIDPSVDEPAEHDEDAAMDLHAGEEAGHSSTTAALPGLASAEAGYRLVPDRTSFAAGERTLGFRIVDSAGDPVRDFDVEHARAMHLIVVRRDFTGFQHLHPRLRPDGTWEAEADLGAPGVYRAFADFSTGGESLTLATDLFVAGRFDPAPLPAPSSIADAGGSYEVELLSEEPQAGETTPVRFVVSKDGRRVDGVQPYLDADGHLVALREHDQAFLHTHPEGEPGGAGPIEFGVEYPTAGDYRLYLQFRHAGEVRTAEFTQTAGASHGD